MAQPGPAPRRRPLLDVYTKDVTSRDLTRLFTHDARRAYETFSGGLDPDVLAALSWPKRLIARVRAFLVAFGLRLSPARRALFGAALVCAIVGFLRYNTSISHGPETERTVLHGFWFMLASIGLLNLLVVLEVADRLSLKHDLEVARNIQLAMLPSGTVRFAGLDVHAFSRPANTVGGDFYDLRPRADGRLLVVVGDVAGKGSPAALLMALFLAMLRVLLDEVTDLVPLTRRLNSHIIRQAPGTRYITLFMAAYDPGTGQLDYVNAGHPPPLVLRLDGRFDRLRDGGGVALGMFDAAEYTSGTAVLQPGELFSVYSDGVTEAEHPERGFFDESGLERSITTAATLPAEDICNRVLADVQVHVDDGKFGDDLTLLVLRRPV